MHGAVSVRRNAPATLRIVTARVVAKTPSQNAKWLPIDEATRAKLLAEEEE